MNPILRFVVIAYALSIAFSLVVGLTGGYESPFIGLKYLSMVLPAIAVLIVAATTGEGPRLGDKYMKDGPATAADLKALGAGFLALFAVGALLVSQLPHSNRAAVVSRV